MQGLDAAQHELVRDKSADFCLVCKNLWPASGAVVSKYHRCTRCGVTIHTACRDLAAKVCPCGVGAAAAETADALPVTAAGQLAVKLLHAYDTTAQPGVTVYGILRVLPGSESVHTASAVVGAQDVVWDGKSYTLPVHAPEDDGEDDEAEGDLDSLAPVLSLEIWRSMYLLLDQQLAAVTISLEPLFRFPNVTAERWFQLQDPDGADWGTVLLQLTFMPQVSSLLASMDAKNVPRERTSLRLSAPLTPAASLQPLTQPEASLTVNVAAGGGDGDGDGGGGGGGGGSAAPPDLKTATPPASPAEPPPPPPVEDSPHPESESIDHLLLQQEAEPHPMSEETPHEQEQHLQEPLPVDEQFRAAASTRSPSLGSEMGDQLDTPPQAVVTEPEHTEMQHSSGEEKPRRRIQRHAVSELSVRPRNRQPQQDHTHAPAGADAAASLVTAASASRPGRPVPDVRNRRSDSDSKVPPRQAKPAHPGFHSTTVKPSFDTTVRDTLRPQPGGARANRANSREAAALPGDGSHEFSGVGRLHIFVLSAHRTPTKDSPNGDHYVRVEIGGQELDCTHTVYQTPNPLFNRKFVADVKHYRTDIRLVLVDASNDRKLGSVDTSVFAIMQRDADSKINWKMAPIEELPIRDGDRLIGHMQVKLAFEEDTYGLFLSQHPHLAAPAPDESFSVERLRIHIARAQAVVQWVTDAIRQYKSVMDWDYPLWTGLLLVMFVYTTLTIDAEYALCAPLFIVVFQLTWSLGRRHFGQYRQFWVERLGQNDESTLPFRPVAHLKVAVTGYKNLTTKLPNGQQGLPFVKVTYLPYGEAPAQSLLPSELLIGCTNTAATDRLPSHSSPRGALDTLRSSALVRSVASFLGSDHARDAILHNVVDTWRRPDSDVEDQTFVYPLLHPIVEEGHLNVSSGEAVATSPAGSVSTGGGGAAAGGAGATGTASTPNSKGTDKQAAATSSAGAAVPSGTSLVPWHRSNALLKFTIYGENPATFMASPWGHVVIPIRDLVADERSGGVQPEVQRWYDVIWTGKEDGDHFPYHEEDSASLSIRAQLELRVSKQPPSELEVETSRTIQSMLDRNGGADKQQSSLSTIWNLRDNVAYVQNVLARILDNLESFKNLLNWTHPRKTAVVYAMLVATWLAFVNIPGRYLILLAGLYEFFKRWIPVPPDDPWTARYLNLLQSIPNDDDLRQVYQHEHEEYLKNKRKRERQRQRRAKLRLVFECQWEGMVKVKAPYWTERFLVVQGHRLVWWTSEADLESGKPPEGQLLLQGHTGLTHASPVDIREVGDDTRLLSVFGRDSKGSPEKRTFLCASAEEKAELEKAIQNAIGLKAD